MSGVANTAGVQRGRPFVPGQSGNPAGRRKGVRNRSTVAAEMLLEGEAEALTRKAIELALAGDVTALRLCMERLVPPRKDRPVQLALPTIASAADAEAAAGVVLGAVATGQITPGEGGAVMGLVGAARSTLGLNAGAPAEQPVVQVKFVTEGRASAGE